MNHTLGKAEPKSSVLCWQQGTPFSRRREGHRREEPLSLPAVPFLCQCGALDALRLHKGFFDPDGDGQRPVKLKHIFWQRRRQQLCLSQ